MVRAVRRFVPCLSLAFALVALWLPAAAWAPPPSFGLLGQWGSAGSAATQLNTPVGIAVSSRPVVHVVDQGNLRLQDFASGGGFLSTSGFGVTDGAAAFQTCESGCRAGLAGNGVGQLAAGAQGAGIDPTDGTLYVADTNNNRIVKYAADGTPSSTIGTSGTGGGNMIHPTGVAVSPVDQSVFVVDQGNKRIDKFDSSGAFVATWGKDVDQLGGTGAEVCPAADSCKAGVGGGKGGEFESPVDVAVDGSGNIYVTDAGNQSVQRFDSGELFYDAWGKNVGGPSVNSCNIAANCQAGTIGTGDGEFYGPFGISVASGAVYVVDNLNHRVQRFDAIGTYVSQFGSFGSGNGQFKSPQRVAVDPGGNVYVTDTGNNRIEKFGTLTVVSNGTELANAVISCAAYDTILLNPGTYHLTGQLNIGGRNLAPNPGSGGNARNIVIDAGGNDRVLNASGPASNVTGVTIQGGLTHGVGGGLFVANTTFVYVRDSAVRNNQSVYDGTGQVGGGGIFNGGDTHAMNVTISGNSVHGGNASDGDAFGGGIKTAFDPTVPGNTYLINATVSGNSAVGAGSHTAAGGGVWNDNASTTEIYGSTIAGNTVSGAQADSDSGGGNLFDQRPIFDGTYLSDTIVAQGASNRAGSENCAVGAGAMVSRGGNVEDRDQCGLTLASDQKNTTPSLGPLQDNGGPIDTRAIPLTSPAVDRALNGPCNVFDARGSARKTAQNPLCDGGAFEAGSKPVPGTAPKCTLKPAGSKVKAPKPRTLKLKVVCDKPAALKLKGKITVKPKKKKGKKKPKAKNFSVSASGNATQAGKSVTLTVKVSKKAIKLLKKKGKGSASFTLTSSNANGSTSTPAKIKKLKLVVKKKKKH